MKKILLLLFMATIARAEPVTATVLEDTKLELTKGKGSIVLKAGSVVEVSGKDGDSIAVIYRSLQGRLPINKTDYKEEFPKPAPAKPKPESKPAEGAPPAKSPAAKSTDGKPTESKPAAPAPATVYGKMVQKARDNEAKHKDSMVEPTDEVDGAKKK